MISKDRLLMQQQIYNFTRSLTIKYDPIAQQLNDTLIRKGIPVDLQNPASWKYYLNMQGKYHPSDTLMYVISLDTQERILFSPEVIVNHPRTRSVYVPGGMYYKRLCETYPEQVDLIKSILFPVTDVTKAIQSPDLTLLGYGSGYLEEYEEKLMIMELEKFLAIIKERWYFDFLDDEPYFYITFWASLTVYIVAHLMATREGFIRTPAVHSWHLWSALKSEGLDDYSDILDRRKSMMLYQNIEYFKANAGKQGNLILLADRLLSEFGVSIYGRRVVQETESHADTYQLTPQLQAVRVPPDTTTLTSEITSENVSTIQTKIYGKGLTSDNNEATAEAIERRLGDTTLNRFMTKFLEIRPITKNKIYSDTLNVFLVETLLTSITKGYYHVPIRVLDPSTGLSLSLYPRELMAIYHYAVKKSLGITPVNIPTKISLYKSFTTEIKQAAPTIPFDNETLYLSTHFDTKQFFDGVQYSTDIENPEEFSVMLSRLWLKYMEHLLTDQSTLIDRRHYMLQYLSSLCHERRIETVTFVDGFTTYEDWLGAGGIDIASTMLAQYDLQTEARAAWGNLADVIMTALVPVTPTLDYFGNFTLSDLGYSRLRQLFVQMCSYRVVFLESSRETAEFAIGAKWSTRYGPDHVLTYGDRTIARYAKQKDVFRSKKTYTFTPGFTQMETSRIRGMRKYTVTTTMKLLVSTAISEKENVKVPARVSANVFTSGALNLCYNGVNVIIPDNAYKDSYLRDSDESLLSDDDDSFLIDPNA